MAKEGRGVTHVMAFAFSGQGHVNPLVDLCITLLSRTTTPPSTTSTLTFTFCVAEYALNRIAEIGNGNEVHPNIRFVGIPYPGLSAKWEDARRNTLSQICVASNQVTPGLDALIQSMKDKEDINGVFGPPACIIVDALLSSSVHEVAHKHGIPWVSFLTCSQHFNLLYFLTPPQFSLPSTYQDKAINSSTSTQLILGGLTLRPIDIPTYFHVVDNTEFMNGFIANQLKHAIKADKVLLNSFWELEELAIKAIPDVLPIGPLIIPNMDQQQERLSMWVDKDKADCLKWLDTKPPHSVIYVSFGTTTILSRVQMEEIAIGLETSGCNLLVVFRLGLVKNSPNASPNEFFTKIDNACSFFVSWSPQLQVLSHPAIGAFITHCGWNSTLEAIYNGVPMLCWPYFCDQMINSRVVDAWKVGMSFVANEDGVVDRIEVERVVKIVMEGDEGKVIRKRATDLKEVALRNILEGGISWKNIQSLIEMITA